MIPFKNYDTVTELSENANIPAGGYVIKILGVEVLTYSSKNTGEFAVLEIRFDIAEGEYKDYYAKNYRSQYGSDKKWKGNYRLSIPTQDDVDKNEFTARRFKTAIRQIEESNPGYSFTPAFDEKTLKGKIAGCIYRDEEWEYEKRTGIKAQPYIITTVEKIRNSDFEIPAAKYLENTNQPAPATAFAPIDDTGFEIINDEDLPF